MRLDRRQFLRAASAGAAAALLPERILADPYAPALRTPVHAGRTPPTPVRIRGVVRSRERGLAGVAISDGLDVVRTQRDGTFELHSSTDRDFVRLCVPAGHRIPLNPTGTARFYQPLARDRNEQTVSFDLEPLAQSDEAHTLLLLGDIQTENMLEMSWFHERSVPDLRQTVAGLNDREVFGVSCGDIMYDNLELYPEYERGVSRIGIPFFQVVGNHDLDQGGHPDRLSTGTFERHFGPRYYSFDRGAVHYVILDDVLWHGSGYIGYLDDDQLRWLERDLALVEPGRPVIVATHIPVLGGKHIRLGQRRPEPTVSVTNRESLYRLLEPYQAHVLTGHTHESEHVYEHGVHEHVTGAICGAWWSGPICADGTPNGYCIYDVEGETVRWRYKSTGHPETHQLRIYPRGMDSSAPDEFVANVWDWDPDWTVTWFEDGTARGAMARRIGADILSMELHAGPDLPPRRTWVEPNPVGHLFYAPVGPAARELRVEARDRFGRTVSEALRLEGAD